MKNSIFRKTLTLGIIVLFGGVSVVPSISSIKNIDIDNSKDDSVFKKMEYTINFEMPLLKEKEINGDTFTSINMPGSFSIGKAGTPVFQAVPVKLLLPQGMDVASLVVTTETAELTDTRGIDLKESPIAPYQEPVPTGEKPSEFVINTKAYQSRILTPDVTYKSSGVHYCRGYAILTLTLFPTKYNPGEGKLFYHLEMTIKVGLKETGENDPFYRAISSDKTWVESLVVNPDVSGTYTPLVDGCYDGGLCDPSDNGGRGYDYVIITRDVLSDFTGTTYNWSDLINRKQTNGLEATIVTVENILACPDYWNSSPPIPEFNDTAYLIREFCRDAYMDWDTQYILVAGDQDGPNAVERRLMDSYYEGDMESDLYWSNLDNTFNDDLDELWGERDDDGFDLYSELFIGSIPCDEPLDISNWLTKSFFYEDNYDPEYLDNAGFYGGSTGWPTEGDDFIDYGAIKGTDDWLGPDPGEHGAYPGWLGFLYGFETWNENNPAFAFNLSVKWTGEDPNPGWQGGSPAIAMEEFKNAINNNQVTLITAFAHANPYYSMDVPFDVWESDYHNTKPFFLSDEGCHCGDMDGADDGVLHSMLFHSDTELAFACTYNTGFGWGSYKDTNSSSALQQKLFWDYMFNLSKCRGVQNWQLGKAMAWSKDAMANTIDWTYESAPDSWRAVIECCLLFGDPALTIKPPLQEGHNVGVHSVAVDVDHVRSPKPVAIDAVIVNNGVNDEADVVVRLLVNDGLVDSVTIPFFERFTSQLVNFIWVPPDLGVYDIIVNVTITGVAEGYYDDNEKTAVVAVGVLNVDTNECFNSIQEAIDDSDTMDGHSIVVPHGIYFENVVINKNISLLGVNQDVSIIVGSQSGGSVISVSNTDSAIVSGFTVMNETCGVYVESSSNTIIMDTMIVDKVETGILLLSSDNISIVKNEITGNNIGINITGSSGMNTISENEIFDNHIGITINSGCDDNLLYHNNFKNTIDAFDNGSNNQWDNDYADGFRISGGNWWSDYNGSDEYSGPNQDIPGSDGIGDTPYNISGGSNQDRYPLMEPYLGPLQGTIYVDDDNTEGPWDGTQEYPYQHIQDAVDVSIDGDTVFVFNGTYQENVRIDRSIHLIGENKATTIIDGGSLGHVVWITVDMVNITGFIIQNSGTDDNDAGIYIKSNRNTITGNTIANNSCGIYIYKYSNNIISENTITDNIVAIFIYGISQNNIISGNMISNNENGIVFVHCSENHVSGNTIIDTSHGIRCRETSDNIITRNTISGSQMGAGIAYSSSDNNIISENTFEDCDVGVNLDMPGVDTNNLIINNTFDSGGIFIGAHFYYPWNTYTIENNTINGRPIRYYKNTNDLVVPQDTGQVILANCSNITIQNLTIFDVVSGIQLGSSSRCIIKGNTITNNTNSWGGGGIRIEYYSTNNKVYNNTISLNFRDGIRIIESNNNVISCNNLLGGSEGVYLFYDCNNNTFFGNTITDNSLFGVFLDSCDNSTFSDNKIENNGRYGLYLVTDSHYNTIYGNTISNHTLYGIYIPGGFKSFLGGPVIDSENNTIYHNNFINNTQNAYDECNNTWDNGYPDGGNYWDDFSGVRYDSHHGENQTVGGSDGIIDQGRPNGGLSPYLIPGSSSKQDNYPFKNPSGWRYLPGDLNFDGQVGLHDLAQLLPHYGMTEGAIYEDGDIDGDGDVDLSDLAELLAHYGEGT